MAGGFNLDIAHDDALRTLADLPFFISGRYPHAHAVGRCRGETVEWLSSRELFERIRDVALGLAALGLAAGERLALASESRPEWLVVDLAALTIGAVVVPVYPTLTAGQAAGVMADAGVRMAVGSDAAQVAKLAEARAAVPSLETLVGMTAAAAAAAPGALDLDAVAASGHDRIRGGWGVAREYRERAAAIGAGDLATLIYTSGTTGEPKGVMLTHANIVSNVKGCLQVLPVTTEDVALSFLPLSHAFERTVVYTYLAAGVSVVFAEGMDTLPRDLVTVRPTIMTGVPRVFEKVRARVLDTAARGSAVQRAVFAWAVRVGEAWTAARLEGRGPGAWTRLTHALADRFVFARVRAGVGGRVRALVSGSAALSPAIGRFFFGAGLTIVEGYGLTETAPVLTVNPFTAPRFGTVGPPLPEIELRIADDGEILTRGPNVMKGYYGRPEATAAVLVDGWFHTGDVGRIDPDGFLVITDRKKDMLVTSGGKKIAPQPIENVVRLHPLVSEAVLLGERRRFPALLIVPDFTALEHRLRELGRRSGAPDELVRRPDVIALYQAIVDEVNLGLAQFERVKKIALLPEEFSIARGELTPTMKVRRRAVEQRWSDIIEGLYAEPAPGAGPGGEGPHGTQGSAGSGQPSARSS